MSAWNKGKKMPHSPEWEAKRLSACRRAIKNMIYPKGYKRPKEYTQPMVDSIAAKRLEDPEKHNRISIKNLPKNCSGSKNGNWKGGITEKKRGIRFSKEGKSWRKLVFDRDGGRCRLCGSKDNLHAHHIIPISECSLIAWVPMNGVILCKSCHYKEDEAWRGKRFSDLSPHSAVALIFSIPHKFQAYPTVGNWQFTSSGVPVIFVSKMSDPRYEALVGLHELVEVLACMEHGVTQKQVDAFDIEFEKNREKRLDTANPDEAALINIEEPGDQPDAPYAEQHCFATGIERLMASALNVNWAEYEQEVESL